MSKVAENHKSQIISLMREKQRNLGSTRSLATFLNISPATASLMLDNRYDTDGDKMWVEVGGKLGWKPITDQHGRPVWNVVETHDMRQLNNLMDHAKRMALFIPISDLAGLGKTTTLKAIRLEHVYYIRCRDWGKKEWLSNLCRELGIDTGRGHKTPDDLIQLVIDFFRARVQQQPQLRIDEADKLKASAIQSLIPIYNECEDGLSVVIAGTEALEKEIKKGVQYSRKGYDEIDSRFGRNYLKLIGLQIQEAEKICRANGVQDTGVIKQIIEECKPVRKELVINGENRIIRVIRDIRRLKRIIQREQLKSLQS